MRTKKIMPTTILLVTLLLTIALHFIWPINKFIPLPWNLLGVIPLASGIWINLVADRAFHQAQTTVKPFIESNTLITDGSFRISRNPMYLGFVSILLGVAVLLGSLTPFLMIPIFALLIQRVYIRVEEQMLEAKFGEQWENYQKRVRRWL